MSWHVTLYPHIYNTHITLWIHSSQAMQSLCSYLYPHSNLSDRSVSRWRGIYQRVQKAELLWIIESSVVKYTNYKILKEVCAHLKLGKNFSEFSQKKWKEQKLPFTVSVVKKMSLTPIGEDIVHPKSTVWMLWLWYYICHF